MAVLSLQELNKELLQNSFNKYGITGWDKWNFKQFNLITGENGAGKSRLLRAIRDVCIESEILCIYMDFTQIGQSHTIPNLGESKLADPLLYHGSLCNTSDYANFIPYIEENVVDFLNTLNKLNPTEEHSPILSRRDNINNFLRKHLGRELLFNSHNSECFITSRENKKNKLPFSKAIQEMSPGEKSILYFALGVLCTNAEENTEQKFVLLLDEPENHLHTKALTNLIKDIKNLNRVKNNGKVLIASHSIFLIPLFDFEENLFIKNSDIASITSSIYSNAYYTLIGDPDQEDGSLREMLSSISQWNFSNFLVECLCEPAVKARLNKKDPQLIKLLNVLSPLTQSNEPIQLLDYGSGSGRIAQCLKLYFRDNPNHPLIPLLIYDLFDIKVDRTNLPHAAWMNRIYKGPERNQLKQRNYNIVVLYNVLHEVDVTEWADTLNNILKLLKDDGILVFGERRVLSQGERPYGKSGYLVLNNIELSTLFGPENIIDDINFDRSTKDPTFCCVIKNPRTINVTSNKVSKAITLLGERSQKCVQDYINNGVNANKSREYAFYCQQYINAKHACDLLDLLKEKREDYITSYKLCDIVNNYDGKERIEYIKKRSKYNDEEGKKCREWLEINRII